MQYVFLSHDVDWPKQGASYDHIMARRERFEPDILHTIKEQNPYYNIPGYMDIEEKYGIRSTYFFRTFYENGFLNDYENDIKQLEKGGWEIGLHLDPSSINSIDTITAEKNTLENLCKNKIKGNRVHYLGFNEDLPKKLQQSGFVYDSTFRKSKNLIDENEIGYFKYDNLVEFPLTLMDAYLFTYMKIEEDQIIGVFKKTLNLSRKINPEFNVISVNWHDNVLKMKGGRMYEKIIAFLTSQSDVKIVRGIDIAEIVNKLH